ncbi:MAG TPA: type II secretion system protein [Bacillota bacterium]|nr:type II secretion system protein [Bacillota bacterium]
MMQAVKQEAGFTLLEMLMSVAIIGMLAGITAPLYQSFVQRNDLDITTQLLASTIRRAESYARAGNGDSAWSVEVPVGGDITLFKGTSYGSRNTAFDEIVDIPASITSSGLTEIRFTKFTATPNTTGSFTLTSTTNDVGTVSVNAEGTVDY